MIAYQTESAGSTYINIHLYENFRYIPHLHSGLELVVTLDGECIAEVDGERVEMKKNDAILILPEQLHAFRTESSSRVWVCVFSRDFVPEFLKELSGKVGKSCRIFPGKAMEELRIEAENMGMWGLRALFHYVCALYLRSAELTEREAVSGELSYRIIRYISDHFTEDLTLESVSAVFGYHPGYISRTLSRTVKMSMPRFINSYRVDYARHLLLTTQRKVTEIAGMCGFRSLRNFNLAFRSVTGMEPRQLRSSEKGKES